MNYETIFLSRTQAFPWRILVALGVVVLLVRLLLFPILGHPVSLALKADNWGVIARNVAEGYGYTLPSFDNPAGTTTTPTAYRVPVPVLWFAGIFFLFGFKLWPVMIGNWLLDVATAVVLFQLARYIFPQKRGVAILSVLMYAFYVPEIWTSYVAYSEPIFTLFLMLHLLTLEIVEYGPVKSTA